MPTIADQPITRGSIRLFEQGDWFGEIATNSSERIPDGARVTIVAETLTLSGAVVRGGITDAVGRYQVAGRPEWGSPLAARPSAAYRSANAVLRKTVLADIARDVLGADWASLVVMAPAANLGQHYERPGAFDDVVVLARDALVLLDVPWYVRNDGVTVFDTRPTGVVTTDERVLVEYRNDAIGYRVVNCEDPAAFAPGLSFEGEAIGELVLDIRPDDLRVHVWTRAASSSFGNAVRAVVRRLFPRIELQGVYTYATVGPSQSGLHDLRSTRSRHLPDVKLADMWGGAGVAAELAPGTRVLVAFADSDPSMPVLVAIERDATPVRVRHEASAEIRFVENSTGTVRCGNDLPVPPSPVAVAARVGDAFAQVNIALAATATFATAVGVAVPAVSGAAATLGAAIGTASGAITTLAATPFPVGIPATRLESN